MPAGKQETATQEDGFHTRKGCGRTPADRTHSDCEHNPPSQPYSQTLTPRPREQQKDSASHNTIYHSKFWLNIQETLANSRELPPPPWVDQSLFHHPEKDFRCLVGFWTNWEVMELSVMISHIPQKCQTIALGRLFHLQVLKHFKTESGRWGTDWRHPWTHRTSHRTQRLSGEPELSNSWWRWDFWI